MSNVDLISEVPVQLEEVLKTLQELQKRLQTEMNSGLAGSAGAGVNPGHVRMGMQLAKATADLGREVRAWTKRVKELAGTATLEERLLGVRAFLDSLPESTRAEFLKEFQ